MNPSLHPPLQETGTTDVPDCLVLSTLFTAGRYSSCAVYLIERGHRWSPWTCPHLSSCCQSDSSGWVHLQRKWRRGDIQYHGTHKINKPMSWISGNYATKLWVFALCGEYYGEPSISVFPKAGISHKLAWRFSWEEDTEMAKGSEQR